MGTHPYAGIVRYFNFVHPYRSDLREEILPWAGVLLGGELGVVAAE
jgi:hypothetical protein